MATKYEYYTAGQDGNYEFFEGVYWTAQTFKVGAVAHSITSVKLQMFRAGSPGTITVGIRAVDGSGHPTGADLTSGTTNGNTLTTNSAGELREVAVTELALSPNTTYAIVIRAPSGNASNFANLNEDGSSPTYADGNLENSSNSGGSWTARTAGDGMFEVWGNLVIVPPTLTTEAATGISLD